jgi:hypothetical protein
MNSKQFKLLIGAFFVICGLGVILLTRDRGSWQQDGKEMGAKVFAEFPLNEVTAITITGESNTLNLAKVGEGTDSKWTVADRAGSPANFETISDLLRKTWELKVLRSIKVGASQLASLELGEPGKGKGAGTLLVFKGKDGKELHRLLLGKQHVRDSGQQSSPFGGGSFPDGRYVMPDGKADSVVLVQEPFSSVALEASSWLERDFFKVEKIKSIAVTTTNSWKVSRESETGEWQLAEAKEGEKLDTAKTGSFNYALSSPSFEDVVVDPKPDELGLTTPQRVVLETFDGFTYTVDAGKKEGDESYFVKLDVQANLAAERTPGADEKPEDKERLDKEIKEKQDKLKEKLAQEQALGKWVYKVSNWTLNSVLKDRSELLKKEVPKSEPIPPLIEPPPAEVQ